MSDSRYKPRQVVVTHLDHNDNENRPSFYIITPESTSIGVLQSSSGDFFSDEIQKKVDDCDVVITNPPFSLEANMIKNCFDKHKDFIFIGPETLLINRQLFPHVRDGKMYGYGKPRYFIRPDGTFRRLGNTLWITSFDPPCDTKKFVPTKHYEDVKNLMKPYENYGALNVDKIQDIPMDYDGFMGVPATYLKYRNDDIFKIIGLGTSHAVGKNYSGEVPHAYLKESHGGNPFVDGHVTYARVFIKNITI